jgi:hypothetical protein
MANTAKYDKETILILGGLADMGMTIRLAAEATDIPLGSVSTLATKNDIQFKGKIGKKRADKPVRPYRAYQKKYLNHNNDVDTLSMEWLRRKL